MLLITYEEYGKEVKYLCVVDWMIDAKSFVAKELNVDFREINFEVTKNTNHINMVYEYNIGDASYMAYEIVKFSSLGI